MVSRYSHLRRIGAGIVTALALGVASLQAQMDPVRIDGLVVTATAVPVALSTLGAHVTLLDGDELRSEGVLRITDALRTVPGVVVVESGSPGSVASVFMRGGESDYVQVLVDGVQVNQPGGGFDFSGLTTAAVERVEIVRGPTSALHGSDAVAGVIHIITRDGNGASPATLSVRGGSFGRMDAALSVAGGDDAASYGATLSRATTDGILEFNNRHENTVLSGKAAFRIDPDTRARLSGRIGQRRYHFPTDFTGALVDENQFTFADESSLAVELERVVHPRVRLRALATAYGVDGGTDDAPDGPADTLGFYGYQSQDSYHRSALDLRTTVGLWAGSSLTVGGEYEEQRIRSFNESLSQFGASGGRSRNDRGNRAGYLHVVGVGGAWGGNAGLRFEDNDRFGGFLTWQAGLSWQAPSGLRLRASAGRGIKEPTFFETFASGFTVGNPGLEPERSTSWEVGADQTLLDGRLRMEATWFNQDFRDLIQYTATAPAPGGPNYFNVAAASSRGIEAGLKAFLGPWSAGLDATWLDTRVTDAGFDQGPGASFVDGEPLLRRPEVTVSGFLDWSPDPRLSLGVSARRVGDRWDRDFGSFPAEPVLLGGHTLVDARAGWTVMEARPGRLGLALSLHVENLGDERYQEVFGYRGPGRAVYLGGTVRMAR
jgi:vitamin B12 transporter